MTTEYQTALKNVFNIFDNFIYNDVQLSIIKGYDAIWVRAKDITTILKYKNTKVPIIYHVDDDDKMTLEDLGSRLDLLPEFDTKINKNTQFTPTNQVCIH